MQIFNQGNENAKLYKRYTKCKWVMMRDTKMQIESRQRKKYN